MPREILEGARDLITEGDWCQGVDARDGDGGEVKAWSPEACAWSVLGALIASEGVGFVEVGRLPIQRLAKAALALGHAVGDYSLQTWNDAPERTRAEVLAAFDDALATLEAAEEERASAGK